MPNNTQPILAIRNLKTYFYQDEGIVRAVDGVSFDVYPGQTLGIVGESGCGKSVTARSILRIVDRGGRIEGGEVWLRRHHSTGQVDEIDLARLTDNGREIRAIRGAEIALIFQEPMTSLSAYHTVGNQIIEAIRLHKPISRQEAREQAVELLRMVGIPRPARRLNEYSFQLSGGLRQRVMIAMALACDPKVLIADEPTTALDVTTQAQILDLLRQLQAEKGLSIILITHDMGVTIGLVGVALSLFLGILLGGISGLYGGWVDNVIQRIIEIVRSIPTIPLWMGLAAALPREWPITRIYFFITIIISLIGWTVMARVVRGRFLSLRTEDFVMAAELAGASQLRIILRHMVPSFLSHIIAATSLAIPAMIISETSLSFLGLGLRPPAVSWGVLLQQAQNIQAVAISPWLLTPAIPVVIAVLAFNFLGDGLRDAADPYG